MKKVKKVLLGNTKAVITFVLGILISGVTVYAATSISSSQVTYTGNSQSTVQGALDTLYTRSNTWINPNDNFGTPQYYAFGTYKGWCGSYDSTCNSYSDFPTTSTSAPSGKNVYATKYANGGYGVCIKRNGKEHCFRGRNWAYELQHVQRVFSDISCSVYSSDVYCNASDFRCTASSDSYVYCRDYGTSDICIMYANGSVKCSDK